VSHGEDAAIALLSGGLDSVAAAAMWLAGGNEIACCLTFDYGQRAVAREMEHARRFAESRGLAWQGVELPWLALLAGRAGSALVDRGRGLPPGTTDVPGDEASARAVWVPARNAVLLTVAAAHAEAMGAGVVLAGFNREEAATFTDNSVEFVDVTTKMLALATQNGVRVVSPTLTLDKPSIVREAHALGIAPGDCWSCYAEGPAPCGRCESCLRSARAWAGVGS
jgi:7-cyano-7-deazaguanine synthase